MEKQRREKINSCFKPHYGTFLALLVLFTCLILPFSTGAIYWVSDLDTDLELYYNFEESSGDILDQINANDGKVSTPVTRQVDGIWSKGYLFGPDNASVNFSKSAFDPGAGDFTINIWAKSIPGEYLPAQNLISSGGAVDHYAYMNIQPTGYPKLRVRDVGVDMDLDSNTSVNDTDWHMYTAVRGSNLTLYIDGNPVATMVDNGAVMDISAYGWAVGSSTAEYGPVGNEFNGTLDELGIWTRELNATEIGWLLNNASYTNFVNYEEEITEGVSQTISINTTQTNAVTGATLWWDGTEYAGSLTNPETNLYSSSVTFITPLVSADVNKTFFFTFDLNDSTQVNSSSYNQTVFNIGVDDCSAYGNHLYNFTVYNEKTLAQLNAVGDDVDGYINLQVYDSAREGEIVNYSQSFNSTNPFAICMEESISANSTHLIDVQVQYMANGYASEFYHIVGDTLDSDDMNTQIPLYLLDNDTSQEFKILYKDASFLPIPGAVIQVQRKYVGEGIFRTVEQPLTDINGETLAHLEVNDAIYNFIILLDGEIDATFTNVIAVCPNPTFDECEITLNNIQSHINIIDFASIGLLSFLLEFDRATRTVSSTFSVVDGTAMIVDLNVTLFDAFGNQSVCTDTLVASGGSLSCVVPNSFGNATVVATLYGDNEAVGRSIIHIGEEPRDVYGGAIVFIGITLLIGLIAIGLSGNPLVYSVILIFGVVLLFAMNILYSPSWIGAGATILWLLIAIGVIIIKGGSR